MAGSFAQQIACESVYILLSIILPSTYYVRVVYIYISKSKCRRLECYCLMRQIGTAQLLAVLSAFFGGLMHATTYDHLGISTFTAKISAIASRLEPMLSFVLALNRPKITS
ncbi:hypothetical protein L596_026717 [Steinernema carpocapsae]|uniref:Uncharacterized protein n=1 Tax=Steinernema carpocapsae TaxID=34508 RepID=A0A4U5M264_STECR|nr:hypothetical protein L596_026717 [Steinernema carpocapsae]